MEQSQHNIMDLKCFKGLYDHNFLGSSKIAEVQALLPWLEIVVTEAPSE